VGGAERNPPIGQGLRIVGSDSRLPLYPGSPKSSPHILWGKRETCFGITHFGFDRSQCGNRERQTMPRSVFSAKYTRFREMLVEARKAKGMTQMDLALRLDRKQSYVSKFERGERRLDIVEFLEVAELLEVDVLRFIEQLL
jgi:hypothetical protein